MQLENGGWGWWDADEPNAWLTAYAVWGLHKAKQAGVPVPETMYRKGVDALRRLVVQRPRPRPRTRGSRAVA
jgi:uncharacterized protein YfaS (alpha-2-macroglobulin family)